MTKKRASNQRPNLLYIHSDQHNPAVMGCGGDALIRTPNLDRLAKNGALFENVYCPSPVCVPSRMSMLTGRFPYENEVWTNAQTLSSAIPTFAHAMGAAGYRPVLIGRMHAIGPDQLHGYAERLIGDHCSNFHGGRPPDHGMLTGTQEPLRVSLEKSGTGQNAYQVHDEYVTAATVDYLNRIAVKRQSGVGEKPFCITVGFMLPHQPFVARPEDYAFYDGRILMPGHPEPIDHPYLQWFREKSDIQDVSKEEVMRARTAYWALVTRMDMMIGQIMDALQKNGLADNTIVIYCSDHGEQVGEHGLWWKQTFYENSVKVPLILSWPGNVAEGMRCKRVVSSLDLNATMLDMLQAPPLPHSHGRSLVPLLQEKNAEWEDVAFSEYCYYDCIHRMIRWEDWKLNYYRGHPSQLYNLKEDPDELNDLAGDPNHAGLKEKLTRRLLEDWDPEVIAERYRARQEDLKILEQWAETTHPRDQYRWDLRPEMDYLDRRS